MLMNAWIFGLALTSSHKWFDIRFGVSQEKALILNMPCFGIRGQRTTASCDLRPRAVAEKVYESPRLERRTSQG